MKSNAPSLVASTAVLTVAWPEMITTGSVSVICRIFWSASSPSSPGIRMSMKTRSGGSRSMIASPSGPLEASWTSYPSYSRIIRTERRISASSSMTRMRAFMLVRGAARSQSFVHCGHHDASLPHGRIVSVKRQRVTRVGRAQEALDVGRRPHGLPVDLHDDEPAPHGGDERRGGRIHARHEHAMDGAGQLHAPRDAGVELADGQAQRRIVPR